MSSNGRITTICGHNISTKMSVSKSKANHGRKYWKRKYWGKEKYFCQYGRETNLDEGEIIQLLTIFGKDFRKEIGTQLCSKEVVKMKKNIENLKKKMKFVIAVVISSWVFSSIGFRSMYQNLI